MSTVVITPAQEVETVEVQREIVVGGIHQTVKSTSAALVEDSIHVVTWKNPETGEIEPKLTKTGEFMLNARVARMFDKENNCVKTIVTGEDIFVYDREGNLKVTSQNKPITKNGIHCWELTCYIPKETLEKVLEGKEVSLQQFCFTHLWNNGFDEDQITQVAVLKQAFIFIMEAFMDEDGLIEVFYTSRSYSAPQNANGGVFWMAALSPELLEEQLHGFWRQDKSISTQRELPTNVHNLILWKKQQEQRAERRSSNSRQVSRNTIADVVNSLGITLSRD